MYFWCAVTELHRGEKVKNIRVALLTKRERRSSWGQAWPTTNRSCVPATLCSTTSTMSSAIISSQPTAVDTLKLAVKEFNSERQGARHYHGHQCSTSSFFSRHRAKIGTLIVLLLLSISAAAVLFWSDIVQESANTGGLGLWKRVTNSTQNNTFVSRKCE